MYMEGTRFVSNYLQKRTEKPRRRQSRIGRTRRSWCRREGKPVAKLWYFAGLVITWESGSIFCSKGIIWFCLPRPFDVQENDDKSLHKFVHDYFEHFWKDNCLNCSFDDHKKILRRKQVSHLTDFLRYFIVPSERKFGKSIKRLPCATKLAEEGVEFRKVNVEAGTESYKRDKAKASSARQNDTREEQSKLKS